MCSKTNLGTRSAGITEPTVPIAEVSFDNGIIAHKVGMCRLDEVVDKSVLDDIIVRASGDDYSVVYVTSAYSIEGMQHCLFGNVMQFHSSLETVLTHLERFPVKFHVRPFTSADWPEIEKLYEHSSPTRFSMDPRIGEERARRHKLLCLRAYHERFGRYFSVALNSQQNIIGFQVCLPRDGEIDLYEAVVLPQHRIGFAAADMLRYNLLLAKKECPDKSNLVTRIYSDNVVSTNYHERLGMVKTQGDYFYHLWIKQG